MDVRDHDSDVSLIHSNAPVHVVPLRNSVPVLKTGAYAANECCPLMAGKMRGHFHHDG